MGVYFFILHVRNNKKSLVCCFKRCYNKVFRPNTKTNKRGELIMTQGVLGFKYEEEKKILGPHP